MNIIEFFAKGGKTTDYDLIKGIQNILEVSNDEMVTLWQIGLNKYGSEEGIADALQEATKNLTQNSSKDEIKSAVASVFSQESEMFKCGGKMRQLANKMSKGGDCGCKSAKCGGKVKNGGVVKAQNGAKWISEDRTIKIINPNTAQADTLGTYSYPSRNGEFRFKPNGERTATEWLNGDAIGTQYANDIWMKNHPVRSIFRKKAPEGYFENLVERVNNRTKTLQEGGEFFKTKLQPNVDKLNYAPSLITIPSDAKKWDPGYVEVAKKLNDNNLERLIKSISENAYSQFQNSQKVPTYQEGVVLETESPESFILNIPSDVNLSRREALDLAQENKGFNKSQSRFAYQNAKNALRNNTDLTGSELRNAARNMIAGSHKIVMPVLDDDFTVEDIAISLDDTPITLNTNTPEVKTLSMEHVYDNMSFKDAFRSARNRGEKIFKWRGKDYNTNLAPEPIRKPKPAPVEQPSTQIPTEGPSSENNWEWRSTPHDWSEGWRDVAERNPQLTDADRAAIENSKKPWFVRATEKAAFNENPAVMTASGWKHDKNGNVYQTIPTEAEQQLGKNLAVIGASGLTGMAANAALTSLPKIAPRGIWNPVQSRVGSGYSYAANGALRNNLTGQLASRAGLNVGQFAPGTDYAMTMANNLRMVTPYGFKCGGKLKKKRCGGSVTPENKCGGRLRKIKK